MELLDNLILKTPQGEMLYGGLDHIFHWSDSIEVYDRGRNGKANDFEIVVK